MSLDEKTRAARVAWGAYFNRSIPDVCLDIKMSLEGASDTMSTGWLRSTLPVLEARYKEWQYIPGVYAAFDEAVFHMLAATIHLVEAELKKRSANPTDSFEGLGLVLRWVPSTSLTGGKYTAYPVFSVEADNQDFKGIDATYTISVDDPRAPAHFSQWFLGNKPNDMDAVLFLTQPIAPIIQRMRANGLLSCDYSSVSTIVKCAENAVHEKWVDDVSDHDPHSIAHGGRHLGWFATLNAHGDWDVLLNDGTILRYTAASENDAWVAASRAVVFFVKAGLMTPSPAPPRSTPFKSLEEWADERNYTRGFTPDEQARASTIAEAAPRPPENLLTKEEAIVEVEKLFGPWQETRERGIPWLTLACCVARLRADTKEWDVCRPVVYGKPAIAVLLDKGRNGIISLRAVTGLVSRCVLKHVRLGNLTPTLPATP